MALRDEHEGRLRHLWAARIGADLGELLLDADVSIVERARSPALRTDPERMDAPAITAVHVRAGAIELAFSESITVKGSPRLVLADRTTAVYRSGSGTNTLTFAVSDTAKAIRPARLDLRGGAIVATEATSTLRLANVRFLERPRAIRRRIGS